MNRIDIQPLIYELVSNFFVGAEVSWAEQGNTTPKPPYVTLKFGSIQRASFPCSDEQGDYYQCNVPLEVNLYTKGRPITVNGKPTGEYANTATSDLMSFADYVDSSEASFELADKGVGILLMSPIRDLTSLENSNSYRYRAMTEFLVTYPEAAYGAYGIAQAPKNYSGGGTDDLRKAETPTVESFEITENQGGK